MGDSTKYAGYAGWQRRKFDKLIALQWSNDFHHLTSWSSKHVAVPKVAKRMLEVFPHLCIVSGLQLCCLYAVGVSRIHSECGKVAAFTGSALVMKARHLPCMQTSEMAVGKVSSPGCPGVHCIIQSWLKDVAISANFLSLSKPKKYNSIDFNCIDVSEVAPLLGLAPQPLQQESSSAFLCQNTLFCVGNHYSISCCHVQPANAATARPGLAMTNGAFRRESVKQLLQNYVKFGKLDQAQPWWLA